MKLLSTILLGLILSPPILADHRRYHNDYYNDHYHDRYYYYQPRFYQEIPRGYIPPIVQYQQFYNPMPYNYYQNPPLNFSFGFGFNGIILGN